MSVPKTRQKLREAEFFFNQMLDNIETYPFGSEEFGFYLSAFLSAGRSVTFVLQYEEPDLYGEWFDGWKLALSEDDQSLLKFMNEQRVAEVHCEGAAVQVEVKFVRLFELKTKSQSSPYYGFQWFGPPGVEPPTVGKGVPYFETGGGTKEEAIETCKRYRDILRRLVGDFPS